MLRERQTFLSISSVFNIQCISTIYILGMLPNYHVSGLATLKDKTLEFGLGLIVGETDEQLTHL